MPSTLIVGEVIHTHDLSSYNYVKGGRSKDRSYLGGRGVMFNGGPERTVMDYINIGVIGNAVDFAENVTGHNTSGSVSNG